MFAELADNILGSVPNRPKPLDQNGLLALFSAKDTGGDIVLEPATDADMRGKNYVPKPSLEVVYDDV
jgi:chlorophyllide a reductase subunit X